MQLILTAPSSPAESTATHSIGRLPRAALGLLILIVLVASSCSSSLTDRLYFGSEPTTTVVAGSDYAYQPSVSASSSSVTYTLEVAPSGMGLGANGLVSWQTTEADIGAHTIRLLAKKGSKSGTQTWMLNVVSATPALPLASGGAPIASAGVDFGVEEGQTPVKLDGSESSDPLGGPLTFAWMQLAGSPVTLSNPVTSQPTFTAPIVALGGETLSFMLTVISEGGVTTSTVNVNVVNVNHLPVADAGDDQLVAGRSPVKLHGEDSFDVDNHAFTYTWLQIGGSPIVTLSDANSANPTFVAPQGLVSPLVFELTVDDGFLPDAPAPGYNFGDSVSRVTVDVADGINSLVAAADRVLTVDESAVIALDVACAEPSTANLWPPTHGLVPVSILGVGDPSGSATITIDAVHQDEVTSGLGGGDTAIDAFINEDGTVLLRAERDATGNGRVYHIHFTASDDEGSASSVVTVTVSGEPGAVDDGALFESTH